jgi:hypothetical protein
MRSRTDEETAIILNIHSRKFPRSSGTSPRTIRFLWRGVTDDWRRNMTKLAYVFAALATLAVAAPTIASAEDFGFRIGSDRDYYRGRDYYGPRVEFYRHDNGWHRGWYHRDGDREVIIRRHHYWED